MIGRLRRKDKQMDPAEARSLLEQSGVGRLGLVLPDGRPYVVPVNFVFQNDRVYLHSAREGSKVEALMANPHVCFEVDEPGSAAPAASACEVSYSFRSVVTFGKAYPLDDTHRKQEVLEQFARKYAPGVPPAVPESAAAKTLVFEISLDVVTGKKSPPARRQEDDVQGHS